MIPKIVKNLINDYMRQLHEYLPDWIEGVYLHGSITLNSFQESSDIDFMTVVKRPLLIDDIQALQKIHQQIAKQYIKPQMDGMYLQRSDVGNSQDIKPIPFYNDGLLHESGYFNQNPVTWWTLKHYGIRIFGPEIQEFQMNVNVEDLIHYVQGNINSYWKNRIELYKKMDYSSIPEALADEEIEWSVLGVLRQFYTIKEHDIISKLGAGKYALDHLPDKWSNIIQEAIRIRENSKVSTYICNENKMKDTIDFLTFVIEHCNGLVENAN